MRIVLALFLAAHGIAHLPGFLNFWRLKEFPQMPYKTTLLGGRWDVGDLGARITGLIFLLGALAFVAVGLAIGMKASFGPALALGVTFFSLVLTALTLPEARIGLYVDLVLLLILSRFP